MQKTPVFHLFIPHFLQSIETWQQDTSFKFETSSLSKLLTQFVKIDSSNEEFHSIEKAFFNLVNPEHTELPIAYYRHLIQNDEKLNGLICCDPIHLRAGMNDVILTNKITDLTDDEAKELIELLNKNFDQDGLRFIFGSNQCWTVSFPENETVQSHDLDSMLLQNVVNKSLISEQRNWQVIQNETQMLLHSSEVNRHREIAGLKPVNSLWFWGAGRPQSINFNAEKIYYNDNSSSKLRAQIFAQAIGCESEVFPLNSILPLGNIDEAIGTRILLLDQLSKPILENEFNDFQEEFRQIDQNIIKPLLDAWQKDEIDLVIDCCEGTLLKPEKIPAWKFWSKPMNLQEILK